LAATLLLAAFPAAADMYQDGSNAKLPEARENLELGVEAAVRHGTVTARHFTGYGNLTAGGALIGVDNTRRYDVFAMVGTNEVNRWGPYYSLVTDQVVCHSVITCALHGIEHYMDAGFTGRRATINIRQRIRGAPDVADTTLKQYVGLVTVGTGEVNVGGTDATSEATVAGALFGLNPNVSLLAGATHWRALVGMEVDIAAPAGSSMARKYGVQISATDTDAVQGAVEDAALGILNAGGTPGYWKNGIYFGHFNGGSGQWPFGANSKIITVGDDAPGKTVRMGLDLRGPTYTEGAIRAPGIAYVAPGCQSGAAVSTSSATEVLLASCSLAVPLGPNDRIEVQTQWDWLSSANTKAPRVRFGAAAGVTGTLVMGSFTATTTLSARCTTVIANANNAAAQTAAGTNCADTQGTSAPTVAAAVNTATGPAVVNITGSVAGGETMSLMSWMVRVIPAP
jgi:hypothetical protein